jgi:hypothetical protein
MHINIGKIIIFVHTHTHTHTRTQALSLSLSLSLTHTHTHKRERGHLIIVNIHAKGQEGFNELSGLEKAVLADVVGVER